MNSEDMSDLFEKLNINNDGNGISKETIDNLLNMFNSSTNSANSSYENTENNTSNNIDIETIIKMKTLIDKMNNSKNDPRSNLLYSLKPYLKETRQHKLDQYIQLINMSKIIDVFPFLGGDKKNDK